MNKKFLAKLLIFCMVFTMIPMTAFGADSLGNAGVDDPYYIEFDTTNGLTVAQDKELTLTANVASFDATTYAVTGDTSLTWESAQTNIATVSEEGVVTGVAAGKATITATNEAHNATGSVEVTVTAPFEAPKPVADAQGNATSTVTGTVTASDAEEGTLELDMVATADNTKSVEVTIEKATVDSMDEEGAVENVVVKTNFADITLNADVLAAAAAATTDEDGLVITASEPAEGAVSENVVAAVKVTLTAGGTEIMSEEENTTGLVVPVTFNNVTVSAENTEALVYPYYYVDGVIDGTVNDGSGIKVEDGKVTVEAKHFSIIGLSETQEVLYVTYTDGTHNKVYDVVADTDGKFVHEVATFDSMVAQYDFAAPAGQVFDKWKSDDSAINPTESTTITLTKNVTLTATWTDEEEPEDPETPTTSGGGSSSSNVSIATKVTGGKVTVTPTRPTRGQTVTVTVTPADGYKLDSLKVADLKGNEIELTKVSDTKYTFVMPSGKVTVTPVFVKTDGTDKTEEPSNISKAFSDIVSGAWYEEYISYVVDNGLMNGYEDGRFGPNDQTTRAQIVTVLFRLEGEPAVSSSANFSDVSAGGQYYSTAVAWASRNGIVNGYEDGRFGPNDNVTREQIATILYRYAQLKGYDTSLAGNIANFSDAANVSSWATDAIAWAVAEGLMNGDNGALKPQGNATRAEIATLLARYAQNIAK